MRQPVRARGRDTRLLIAGQTGIAHHEPATRTAHRVACAITEIPAVLDALLLTDVRVARASHQTAVRQVDTLKRCGGRAFA